MAHAPATSAAPLPLGTYHTLAPSNSWLLSGGRAGNQGQGGVPGILAIKGPRH
jgi:hypothetical protein